MQLTSCGMEIISLSKITRGTGRMRIGEKTREVTTGDAIAIPPRSGHKIWNTGAEPLRLLCRWAPAYEHDDIITKASPGPVQYHRTPEPP